MKKIDPKIKEAVNVLKFLDYRIRQELKNRENSSNDENAETPQFDAEDARSLDLGIQQPLRA